MVSIRKFVFDRMIGFDKQKGKWRQIVEYFFSTEIMMILDFCDRKKGRENKPVRKLMTGLLLCVCSVFSFSVNASGPMVPYSISEVKVLSLKERQIVAIALDDRIPGEGIDNVLGYKLNPVFEEKRQANQLQFVLSQVNWAVREMPNSMPLQMEVLKGNRVSFSLKGADANRAVVDTVRRKTVKGRDGTIRMRTYVVVTIPKETSKKIPTVVIDPGHGGADTGAVKNFIREKDINLDIALRAARLFEAKGWDVLLTRRTDVEPSLLERADMANLVDATVFISIHHNSLPEEKISRSREFGTTVLYNSQAINPAYDLARMMQEELIGALGTQREVLQDRPKLVVLNSTWVPAVLTEGIMMPNPANAKLILDRVQRQRSAEAIFRATENWQGKKVMAAKRSSKLISPPVEIKLLPTGPEAGNVAGNIVNRGTLATSDDWIYYLKKADSFMGEKEETIWRFLPDRFLSDQLVIDQEAWELNIQPDGLFFSNWSDGQALYQVDFDGSNPRKLTDGPVQQINFSEDRLIFVRNRQIYSMPRKGGLGLQVTEDEAENTVSKGDWIYYANGSDSFRPYRIYKDGTRQTKLSEDETLFLTLAGDWLLFSNLSDGEKLYRMKTDGSQRAKVSDDRVGYINYDSNFIYYTDTDRGHAVFRIRPDGSGRKKIMSGSKAAGPLGIAAGRIYYQGLFQDLK